MQQKHSKSLFFEHLLATNLVQFATFFQPFLALLGQFWLLVGSLEPLGAPLGRQMGPMGGKDGQIPNHWVKFVGQRPPFGRLRAAFWDHFGIFGSPWAPKLGPGGGPRPPCEGPNCSKVQFCQNVKIELSCKRELHFGGSGRGFWLSWAVGECFGGVRRRSGASGGAPEALRRRSEGWDSYI